MKPEEQGWEDDETSVADSRLDVKAIARRSGQPIESGVANKKPPAKSSPASSALPQDDYGGGESKTSIAPPPSVPEAGTDAYEARRLLGADPASAQPRARKVSPHVVRHSEAPLPPRAEQSTNMQFVDPLVGRVLACKYRVVRHIASGGMGSVYEAEHIVLGHRVAVKVLHTHLVKKPESAKRFLNEAKVAANLDHPNVVRAVDVDETEDGVPFFVLEYLDGQPLSAVLGRGRHLPVRRSLQIIMQLLSALEAAHEKGIVHRDIKPENIFLLKRSGDQEHVKVLDFGIAKISAATRATSQGKVFGTPMYMSPEQLKDSSNVDERTDIYAVGVLLYEMLGGTVPFVADGLAELMMATVTSEPTPLAELRVDLPEGLGELVRAAFAAEREDRPPTVATFRHELSLFQNAVTQMELERVALDPEAGTLDPDAVRNIKAWRKKRTAAAKSKRSTSLLVVAGLCLLVAGVAVGAGVSNFRNWVTVEEQTDQSVPTVDPVVPAPFEVTPVVGVAPALEQPAVNEENETRDEGNDVAEEVESESEEASEAAETEEPQTEAAKRAAAERARRRRAARRSARRREKRTEAERSGLGFQNSF